MASTYDPTAIETSVKDRLRAMVGDVTAPFNLTDEEVSSFFSLAAGLYSAAASICRSIAGRLAPEASVSLGTIGVGASPAARYYLDLAARFDAKAVLAGEGVGGDAGSGGAEAAPVVTGTSVAAIEARACDPDRPSSVFDPNPYRDPRRGPGYGYGYGWPGWRP